MLPETAELMSVIGWSDSLAIALPDEKVASFPDTVLPVRVSLRVLSLRPPPGASAAQL